MHRGAKLVSETRSRRCPEARRACRSVASWTSDAEGSPYTALIWARQLRASFPSDFKRGENPVTRPRFGALPARSREHSVGAKVSVGNGTFVFQGKRAINGQITKVLCLPRFWIRLPNHLILSFKVLPPKQQGSSPEVLHGLRAFLFPIACPRRP